MAALLETQRMPCYWPSPDHRAVNATVPEHHDTVSALKYGTSPSLPNLPCLIGIILRAHNRCTLSYNLQLTLCLFPLCLLTGVDVDDRSKYVALGAECLLLRPWPSVAGARRDAGFLELLLSCFLLLPFSIPLKQLFCSFSVPVLAFFFHREVISSCSCLSHKRQFVLSLCFHWLLIPLYSVVHESLCLPTCNQLAELSISSLFCSNCQPFYCWIFLLRTPPMPAYFINF